MRGSCARGSCPANPCHPRFIFFFIGVGGILEVGRKNILSQGGNESSPAGSYARKQLSSNPASHSLGVFCPLRCVGGERLLAGWARARARASVRGGARASVRGGAEARC